MSKITKTAEAVLSRKKVAVVGLGVAGLTAVKNLIEQGFDVVGLERNEYIGGLWRYTPDPTQNSILTTTKANNSHQTNAYTDFPYPIGTPDYPSGEQVAAYLESYAEKFKILQYCRLGETVQLVRRHPIENKWILDVKTRSSTKSEKEDSGREEVFDRVYLTTGALAVPHVPTFPGIEKFKGQVLHTREYKGGEPFEGQRVLVVGLGNTGGDTATTLVGFADKIYLSHRRGGRVLPRYNGGIPSDQLLTRRRARIGGWLTRRLPTLMAWIADKALEQLLKRTYSPSRANPILIDPAWKLLPAPPVASSPATVSDTLMKYFSTGDIRPLTSVLRVTETGFVTVEGEFEVDAIIFATGSTYNYSILADSANPNFEFGTTNPSPYPHLYQTLFSTEFPDSLAMIGPYKGFSVSAMTNSDLAAQAIAQVWKGNFNLPNKVEKENWCLENYQFRQKITQGVGSSQPGVDAYGLEQFLSHAAGTGIEENLGWGWKGWKFWWKHRKLHGLLMDGINTPHLYRLFEGRDGGRKRWEGAEEAIWRLNKKRTL